MERAWTWLKVQEYPLESLEDDEEARLIYVASWLTPKGYDADRLRSDVVYARRSVLREWLRDFGYDPDSLLSFEDDPRLPHSSGRLWTSKLRRYACAFGWRPVARTYRRFPTTR